MELKESELYKQLTARKPASGPDKLFAKFEEFCITIQEQSKYIVALFPEYTPHDATNHLNHLFHLADRILGIDIYEKLNPTEIYLLAFGLYSHDWGMALTDSEQTCLIQGIVHAGTNLIPNESANAKSFIEDHTLDLGSEREALREYVRFTHGNRSGTRIRHELLDLGTVFS